MIYVAVICFLYGMSIYYFYIDFTYYFRGIEVHGLIKGIIEMNGRRRKLYSPLVEVLDGERLILIQLGVKGESLPTFKIGEPVKLLSLKRGPRFYRRKKKIKNWLKTSVIVFIALYVHLATKIHEYGDIDHTLAYLLSFIFFFSLFIFIPLSFTFYPPSLSRSKFIPSDSFHKYTIFWSQEEVDKLYSERRDRIERVRVSIMAIVFILWLWLIFIDYL